MRQINETMACDIVVIGAGVAGLTAAVQASLLGQNVIVLESSKRAGGNWDVTYGMTAVDSPLSKQQGIKVDARALVNQEIRFFNYQVDARLWMDMIGSSGANVEWLMEQGVTFVPELEPYTAGDINAPVFHRWGRKPGPSKAMTRRYAELGGQLYTNTKAVDLISENGAVVGVIAEKESGDLLQIDAKAVICAGGGYTKNRKMVAKYIGIEDYAARSVAENDGSALRLIINAGGKSLVDHGTFITDLIPRQMKMNSHWLNYIHSRPGSQPFHVSVNQDGQRYTDESGTLKLYAFSPAAAMTQERTYTIYDASMIRDLEAANGKGIDKILENAADKEEEGIFRADTLVELGAKLGLDPDAFAKTMNEYNSFCKEGIDREFEKAPEFLRAFENPPYYGWENGYQVCATLEGVDYNMDMQVVDDSGKPIPGLYVAGCDGAKLWRDYYSLAIPGSCNCNNIYSGRKAAQSAAAYSNKKKRV